MVLKVASGGPLNGPVYYQGTWDANANNPFLQSGIGFTGEYYIVSVAGNTTLDGITNWQVGDWAIFNSATNKWEKIDGGSYGTALNIVNDSSSNTAYNLVLTNSSGGLVDTEYVDNGVLTWNPSIPKLSITGVLGSTAFQATGGTVRSDIGLPLASYPAISFVGTGGSAVASGGSNFQVTHILNDGTVSLINSSNTGGFRFGYYTGSNPPYTYASWMTINFSGAISFGNSDANYGTSGQVLTSQGNTSPIWSTPANGTVLSITSGTGITATPNPITSSGTIALANTAVTAGTYGSNGAVAQVTINAQGQITNAQNVAITIPSGNVTGLGTMATQNANAVVITGGTINTATFYSANIQSVAVTFPNSFLANSSLTIGNVTISLGGTATSIGNLTLSNVTIAGGSISNVAIGAAITTKNTAYTATANNETILANVSAGAFAITLPTAVGATGKTYCIKKIDSSANAVTVNTTSAQTIDGATSRLLTNQYDAIQVQGDGSNWFIIANTFGRNGTAGTF